MTLAKLAILNSAQKNLQIDSSTGRKYRSKTQSRHDFVGTPLQEFRIYHYMLTLYSPYFVELCRDLGPNDLIEFPNDCAKTFRLVKLWIYIQANPLNHGDSAKSVRPSIEMWKLAVKYELCGLRDEVLVWLGDIAQEGSISDDQGFKETLKVLGEKDEGDDSPQVTLKGVLRAKVLEKLAGISASRLGSLIEEGLLKPDMAAEVIDKLRNAPDRAVEITERQKEYQEDEAEKETISMWCLTILVLIVLAFGIMH